MRSAARDDRPDFHAALGVMLLAVLAGPLPAMADAAEEDPLRGFPFAVVCSHDGALALLYLNGIKSDGTGLYTTLDRRRAGTIGLEGPSRVMGDFSLGDCAGK